MQRAADCRTTPVLRPWKLNVDGDYAAGSVDASCMTLVDDGSLGRSCGNVLGCMKKVTKYAKCKIRFQWKAEWALDVATCKETAPPPPTSDADCASRDNCKANAMCWFVNGQCGPRNADDCRASDWCIQKGQCGFAERPKGSGADPCVATSAAECEASKACSENQYCSFVVGADGRGYCSQHGPSSGGARVAPSPAGGAGAIAWAKGDTWKGSYSCARTNVPMLLKIMETDGTRVSAILEFDFAGTKGSFWVSGQYLAASRRLDLTPGTWVDQPKGFGSVPLTGTLDAALSRYSGEVKGCGPFLVTRSRP